MLERLLQMPANTVLYICPDGQELVCDINGHQPSRVRCQEIYIKEPFETIDLPCLVNMIDKKLMLGGKWGLSTSHSSFANKAMMSLVQLIPISSLGRLLSMAGLVVTGQETKDGVYYIWGTL